MTFQMMLMLVVSFQIGSDVYSQVLIWALFVYIIAKDAFLEYLRQTKPDREARLRSQIMEKLNKAIDQIKNIV